MTRLILISIVVLVSLVYSFYLLNNSYALFSSTGRTIYISGHSGTIKELNFVYKRHHMLHQPIVTNQVLFLDYIYGYESFIPADTTLQHVCGQYPLVIVGDTIRLGMPYYKRVNLNKCKTKFALQITDRVDRWVEPNGKEAYMRQMKQLANNSNVFWLPNNDFEIYYLNKNGIYPRKENMLMIRPYGFLETNSEQKISQFSNKCIIYIHTNFYEANFLLNFEGLDKSDYEIFYQGVYGGPSFLRKQKIFVYFPYQYSTMKVFDNAINGVFTAIPTPAFFQQLALQYEEDLSLMPELFELIRTNPLNWTEYFDVYNKKYIEMYFQFNSWSELYDIISNQNHNKYDLNAKRSYHTQKMKTIMKQHWIEVDNKWNLFFNQLKLLNNG